MLLLTSTSDLLQLITGSAVNVDVHASWVDFSGTTVTPGRTNTKITTAATSTIVAAPAASTQRNVKTLHIENVHASSSVLVTLQHTDGTNVIILEKVTLLAGEGIAYVEGQGFELIDANGITKTSNTLTNPNNFSTAAQTPTAATLTQLTGSSITVPSGKLRIGTMFQWTFDIVKTAAGTATSAYHVRVGTNNSTADAAVLTFTKPAGTAVVDTGRIVIEAIVRGPLSASCIMAGTFQLVHNLQITGHAVIPGVVVNVVSAAFDATVAGLFVSLSCTTGASDAITTQAMQADSINL